jgi:hypothetical protein
LGSWSKDRAAQQFVASKALLLPLGSPAFAAFVACLFGQNQESSVHISNDNPA